MRYSLLDLEETLETDGKECQAIAYDGQSSGWAYGCTWRPSRTCKEHRS